MEFLYPFFCMEQLFFVAREKANALTNILVLLILKSEQTSRIENLHSNSPNRVTYYDARNEHRDSHPPTVGPSGRVETEKGGRMLTYDCPECDVKFAAFSEMKLHLATHKFICSIVNYSHIYFVIVLTSVMDSLHWRATSATTSAACKTIYFPMVPGDRTLQRPL